MVKVRKIFICKILRLFMVKVYHYTSRDVYQKMFDLQKELVPKNYLIHERMKGLPEKAYNPAIYAFLSPKPREWSKNLDFPWIWDLLQHHLKFNRNGSKKVLLRFNLTSDDDSYVVEHMYLEKNRIALMKGTCPYEKHLADCKKFFESRVPILDYKGGFSLPEVIIFSPIDFDRLNIEKKFNFF